MPLGARFEAVLVAARQGEEWAWRQLYLELAPPLLGYLRARACADPEDALGEVFLQLARNLPAFHGSEGALRGWAFLVARNRVLDEQRRRRRRPAVALDPSRLGDVAARGDAEEDAMARLGSARVLALLSNLTDDQREVVLLRVVADLPVAEVARLMGKRPGAVKQLLARALASLRRGMATEGVT